MGRLPADPKRRCYVSNLCAAPAARRQVSCPDPAQQVGCALRAQALLACRASLQPWYDKQTCTQLLKVSALAGNASPMCSGAADLTTPCAGVQHMYVHVAADNEAAQHLYLHTCGFALEQQESASVGRLRGRSCHMLLHRQL